MDAPEQHATSTLTLGGTSSELVTIKLDSCHSTWYFQPSRERFRRTLKGPGVSGVSTGWLPYHGLRFDDGLDGFVVLLNPQGTRLLRSWRHQPGSEVCDNCAEHRTQEVLIADIRQVAQS